MSIAAMSWAFRLDIKPSSLKFLLVALADHANDLGILFPSIDSLCQKTSQDRKTVISGIDKLDSYGFLVDTGQRAGKTQQIKVYRLNGFDSGTRHYTYRLTDLATDEFYFGVRTCIGTPETDASYMGSGTWPLRALREKRRLDKVVLAEHPSRRDAELAESELIRAHKGEPLCRNACSPAKQGRKYPENGTLQTVPFFRANSTEIPAKGTVFPSKESRKRDTESSGNPQEPSGKGERARGRARARTVPGDFEVTEAMREWARINCPGVDVDAETAKFRDHEYADPKSNWPGAWRTWMRRAPDFAHTSRKDVSGKSPRAEDEGRELQQLKDGRADLGMADFRDPYPHESAAVYRTALSIERNRRGIRPGASHGVPALVEHMRLPR